MYKEIDGAAYTFSDTKGTEYQASVSLLVANKVLSGYKDGTFRPAEIISRGAFAKMLFLVMQLNGSSINETLSGTNVNGSKSFAKYVTPLANIGVISTSDYSKTAFAENQPITRGEACKWLVSAYLYAHRDVFLSKNSPACDDVKSLPTGLSGYVATALERELMYTEGGKFNINENVTRGGASKLLYDWIFKTRAFGDLSPSASSKFKALKLQKTEALSAKNVQWAIAPQTGHVDLKMTTHMRDDGMCCAYLTDQTLALINPETNMLYYMPQNISIYQSGAFYHGLTIGFKNISAKEIYSGLIDCEGNWLVEPQADMMYSSFSPYVMTDGKILWVSEIGNENGTATLGELGAVDSTGKRYTAQEWKTLCDTKVATLLSGYDALGEFSEEDIAKVLPKGKTYCAGYTTTGSLSIYSNELARNPYPRDACGIINLNTGAIILEAKLNPYGHEEYDDLSEVYDDCIVMRYDVSGLFDARKEIYDGTTGKLLYMAYEKAESGSPARLIGKYGEGLFCYQETADQRDPITDELISKSERGYMDKWGNTVITPMFTGCSEFQNGYAFVQINDSWGIIRLPQL
jgi:hypothetical protein